jgi:hypothetical protein
VKISYTVGFDSNFIIQPEAIFKVHKSLLWLQPSKLFLTFCYEHFLDIIAAVDEIGYTQPHAGSKKIQVNLKLKDVRYDHFVI